MKKILIGVTFVIFSLFFLTTGNTVNADELLSDNIHNDDIVLYDKFGAVVEPSNISEDNDNLIAPFGANYPTSIKWLNNGASYQSNEFSASGRRYGGYLFNSSTTNEFKITFKKGGFGMNLTSTSAYPGNVEEAYNMPLSGSPYTLKTTKFFYFLVDNPNKGQTYHVKAIE